MRLRRENRLYVSFEKLRTEPDIDSLTYVKIKADRLSSVMRTAKPCTHKVSDNAKTHAILLDTGTCLLPASAPVLSCPVCLFC